MSNPLTQPPFYLIPGIDPNSPISAQTEQIDQLNTLLLRDIDANFAKVHQIITTRILPEIKRFAIGSEPTREAANFWRTFFEAAASTRLPTSDLSTDATSQHDATTSFREDSLAEGASFFHDVVSSTPLPGRSAAAYDDSFSESMESPFDRLDRRLGGLHLGSEASTDMETPTLPSGYDLPGLSSVSSIIPPSIIPQAPNSATPKALRAADTNKPSSWNGLTDLRSTPLNAKFKSNLKVPGGRPPKLSVADLESLRDDDDDVKMTMSPPVTMTFNLPPRAAAIQAAGKTPIKDISKGREANMILDDLMEEMVSEVDSPIAAPEDLMRRYSVLPPNPSRRSMANTSYGSDMAEIPENIVYSNDDTFDQSNDSFDSPPGAATYAPQDIDNSFDSDASPTAAKFNREPTETLFGRKLDGAAGQFQVLGPDEIHTFHGGRLEDAWPQETPTNPNKR